ncbi:hypothetical protein C0Q70_00927 [Pomacea canaliculata]|uniref:G-protein coupled receptors family 1 profile domain-containing protein n=1 Tax=Pomacea canaliculata TaxID=400727 RepID=A0A2T7PY10_POMCA|nr:hypothetical protein C0Q70_00927 [Pomacea canaliculata]
MTTRLALDYEQVITHLPLLIDNQTRLWNMTENFTDGQHEQVEYYKDAQIGFLVVLLILIAAGNAIVLTAISLSRERRRSRMNFFIMHLAVCDLLTGPLVVLSDLIHKLTILMSIMYASTYMLVALSVDRLDAVARPMQFSGSWCRAKILVITAWVFSFLFAIPGLVLFRVDSQYGGPMCIIDLQEPWQWQTYLTLIALALFVVPAFIICICYVIIIVIIWRSSHLLRHSESSRHRGKHRDDGKSSPQAEVSRTSSRGIIPQAKIRTIKMTFIIVLVFIICWSPYFIFNLCGVYGLVPNTVEWQKFSTFIQSLAPLNSAANPVIYGIFSTRICKNLRRTCVLRKISDHICQCCNEESPRQTSATDYTSMTENDEIRLTSDPRGGSPSSARVPYVKQRLSEADKALLSQHVRTRSEEV